MQLNYSLYTTLILINSNILASTTITVPQLMSVLMKDTMSPNLYTQQKNSGHLGNHIPKFDKNAYLSSSLNIGWTPTLSSTLRSTGTPDFSQNKHLNVNLLYGMTSNKDINLGFGGSVTKTDWYDDIIGKAIIGYQFNSINMVGAYGYDHRFNSSQNNSFSDSNSYGLAISWLKLATSYVYNDYQELTTTKTVKSQKNLSLSYFLNHRFLVFVDDRRITYVYNNNDCDAEDKSIGFSYQIKPWLSIGGAHHVTNQNYDQFNKDREHASFNASMIF